MTKDTKIVLRDHLGKVIPTPDNLTFVEFVDKDGNTAMALCHSESGSLKLITKETSESSTYEKLFGVKFAKIKQLFKTHAPASR